MWLFRVKKIIHTPTQRSRNLRGLGFKLYHLMKLLFCFLLFLSISFSGILPCGSAVDVLAVDEDSLQEIPFKYLYVSSDANHEHNYNSDNSYDVFLANNCNLLCYLSEPSVFEVPYLFTLEFDLPSSYIRRLDSCIFRPRSVKADGTLSGSTASTWASVEVRYMRNNGSVATDNYYDYDTSVGGIVCPLDNISTTDVNVHFVVKFWYTNRVGQLGYGVNCSFQELSNNQDRPIIITVKTDSAEIAQLKTIAKNTQDTSTGITGILEFLPNMVTSIGEFFTNLINTIVQKFSDLIDDITDLFSDLTTSLSGFFSNLTNSISGFFNSLKNKLITLFNNITSAISGFFDNLIQNLVDLFDAITTAIGDFFADLLQGIKDFFKWLFIPTTEDIQAVIDTFQEFWGDTPLLIPFQFVSRILESFNNIDFVNGYQWSFTLPRWYININHSNYRIWNNTTIQPFNTDSGVYYIVKHDFSSGAYPYISANSARLGLYWAFWLFVTFKTIMKFAEKLGILDFISTDETQEMLGG